MLRTRSEILKEVSDNPKLSSLFSSWKPSQQEEFLDFCSGARGVKMLYDSFFKEIMNPEYVPKRLEELLSLLLEEQVIIIQVLPNDSVRIADESTLLITDIVVQLEDGSIANVEIQKIGYMFPGQRCACYSADLLLRQYKRVRDKSEKHFSYKDMKSVYTIVLYEKSPEEFKAYPDIYLHRSKQMTDSGLELELLQKYLFIPLDIFQKNHQNKPIRNKLDAWLTFFCMDEPETIIRLITEYPEFKPMYEEIYELCQNTEKVMGMFSKELQELDRNTVQYMIDVMQDTINEKDIALQEKDIALQEKDVALQKNAVALQEKEIELQTLREQLAKLQKQNNP